MSTLRDEVIAEALSWVGTPYQHQMSIKKHGCDCLGLVRGIWRTLYGVEPETVPPYTPSWAEPGDDEILKSACERLMEPLALGDVKPGDVLLFRMRPGCPAKHMAILVAPNIIVHAYW
ncbi:MAG TPA: peptidase P60, partial [Hellea balneolensis]|nr:peptidase P60 [Hellea balneolensis]